MRPLPLASLIAALSVLSLAFGGLGVAEEARMGRLGEAVGQVQESAIGDAPFGGQPDLANLTPATGLRFGIDAGSIASFHERAGVAPDYATVWVGKWNLDSGWLGTDRVLSGVRESGVTPAVHFYYWGDHISKDCITHGCNGKDVHGWNRLSEELVRHLHDTLQGGEAIVILESEFNKHGVHEDDHLDFLLADKASFIRQQYPNAKIVLGLGNWYPDAWDTWDQAAAASDYIGLQALGSTMKDPEDRVLGLFDKTLDGAERLREMYGKPLFVQDVAVSSYPEPDNLDLQEQALARFAAGLPELQAAGVEVVIYRSLFDVPDMALSNHYAEAERHWGLAWHDSGELKPGGQAWVAAVQKAKDVPVQLAPSG